MPQGYKTVFHAQLRLKFIISIISRINTAPESLKARKVFIFQHFSFYEQLKLHAELSLKKSFIISGPPHCSCSNEYTHNSCSHECTHKLLNAKIYKLAQKHSVNKSLPRHKTGYNNDSCVERMTHLSRDWNHDWNHSFHRKLFFSLSSYFMKCKYNGVNF